MNKKESSTEEKLLAEPKLSDGCVGHRISDLTEEL